MCDVVGRIVEPPEKSVRTFEIRDGWGHSNPKPFIVEGWVRSQCLFSWAAVKSSTGGASSGVFFVASGELHSQFCEFINRAITPESRIENSSSA